MARSVLLDIDGVLTVSWRALPGAAATMRWLADHEIGVGLVTNTSSKSRRQIAALLADARLDVGPAEIFTAVSSAASYLAFHHRGARCLVVNEGSLAEDLPGIDLVAPGGPGCDAPGSEAPGVVLLGGAGPSLRYGDFDAVFKLAVAGVPVVALHRTTRFQTAEGLALDMGAFIVGLEAASGIEIPVLGKPAPAFFTVALDTLGARPADAIVVGDDIESDVRGAQAVGMTGVLVRTGKFRPADLESDGAPPDHVIDDIGQLPRLLEGGDGD